MVRMVTTSRKSCRFTQEYEDCSGLYQEGCDLRINAGPKAEILCGSARRGTQPRFGLPALPFENAETISRCGEKSTGRWRRDPAQDKS
jgi:hypothetical protein